MKEEADRLINEFRKLARISGGTGTSEPASIQCAIKCVNELINSHYSYHDKKEHWQKVKQELESRL